MPDYDSGTPWSQRSQEYRDKANQKRRDKRKTPEFKAQQAEYQKEYLKRRKVAQVIATAIWEGMPNSEVMEKFGVTYEDIQLIKVGRTPKHLPNLILG